MKARAHSGNLFAPRFATHIVAVVFLFNLNQNNLQAQEDLALVPNFKLEHVELPGGPSANSINSIVQGPDGFIWFGGHSGLYRDSVENQSLKSQSLSLFNKGMEAY